MRNIFIKRTWFCYFYEMKSFILICLVLISLNLNPQKGKGILSRWTNGGVQEMNIDPADYTWLKKGKLFYFISNDNEFIYLFLKTEDPGVQHKILEQGLTVWVNMDNKSVKKMGVRFPVGSQNSGERKKPGTPDLILDSEGKPATPLSLANTIELTGFVNENERRFPADNPDSFRGLVRYDNDGILHYKLLMPIEKLPVRNSRDGLGAMPITFGIEYQTATSMNSHRSNTAQSGFQSGGMTRGSRGGASGGGRSSGRAGGGRNTGRFNTGISSNPNQNQPPSVLLWIKNIKLASDK